MDRWTGVLKVRLSSNRAGPSLKVTTSLMLSQSSKALIVPSVNAIFFHGDRVEGTGNPVIERLSDSRNIAELLVSKLGYSTNVWVVEASTFNGPFAVYKEFVPSINSRGEPKNHDPNGFPASSSIIGIFSKCIEEVKKLTSSNLIERSRGNGHNSPSSSPCSVPKTIVLGFSKGGTVVNQLITEFAHSKTSYVLFDGMQQHLHPASKDDLMHSISAFHYVDVGLNCSGAYLTDPTIIKKVADRVMVHNGTVSFVLHGTPRQWSDPLRPWICGEKDLLLQLLKNEAKRCQGKLQVAERLYFANMQPSMQMHFEVIESMDLS